MCMNVWGMVGPAVNGEPSVSADKPVAEASWASGAEQKHFFFTRSIRDLWFI